MVLWDCLCRLPLTRREKRPLPSPSDSESESKSKKDFCVVSTGVEGAEDGSGGAGAERGLTKSTRLVEGKSGMVVVTSVGSERCAEAAVADDCRQAKCGDAVVSGDWEAALGPWLV